MRYPMNAYEQGYQTYCDKQYSENNPYSMFSNYAAWENWNKGYNDAQKVDATELPE